MVNRKALHPPMSAVACMIVSGLCFAVVHAAVKWIPRIPVHEIVAARASISLFLTWIAIRRVGLSPWGNNRPMLVFRGLAGTLALIMYFHTLQAMPLATAVTIQYLHPIFTILLAAFFLRERASWLQWLCFAASFAGVLLVKGVDSSIALSDLGIGVASALCSATAYNLIRKLRDEDDALVVMFYLPLISLIVVGPWTLFHFIMPEGIEWLLLVVIGVFTQIAQYFMTKAYQADTAANISNLNYLGILYAGLIGFTFFDEVPTWLATAGFLLVAVSSFISVRWKYGHSAR